MRPKLLVKVEALTVVFGLEDVLNLAELSVLSWQLLYSAFDA